MRIASRLRLAAMGSAELSWRNSHVAPKDVGEVTMVRETAVQPYLGDRGISGDEAFAGVLDPEAPHIFTEGLAVCSPKAACQMNRMHPGRLRSLSQGHGFSIAGTQECNDSVHPGEVL